ncbi:hypothetical protein Acr_21g0005990 [Actinidia rufa]|uniref:Uncharacterized protein n=1 Tax=Actinidia rufa TaxID=165716 RepID=A0A7J0GGQ5_9ERIC|nr:hypothetical protein Acr_21g0005990 [Actinidia rufa]
MDTPYELQSGLGLATGLGLIQLLIQLPHKTARQHPRYLSLINGLLHFLSKCMHLYTEVPAPSHRGALHPPPWLTTHPHRGAPQSTSLCELSWLHLSSLVRTTGENTATDQIESKRDSLRRRRALRCIASQNRLGLLPLSFSMDILHWLHHSCLARLLYISQSISLRSCTTTDPPGTITDPPSTPALTLRTSVQRLLPLSILLANTTGPMSNSSSPCLDIPLQSI